jgi:hypothetical protein
MQQTQLSPMEALVYVAVTGLEARGEPPYAAAIAREANLTGDDLDITLHTLVEKNLVRREDAPVGGADFGPRWCARQPR